MSKRSQVALGILAWVGIALAPHALAGSAPERVSFWCYSAGTLGRKFQEIATQFNDVQQRYRVEITTVPWNSRQKALCALAAGIPPDVLMLDGPSAPDWVARDALVDVTDRVKAEGWSTSEFFSGPWQDTDYQGRAYIIPVYGDIRCLVYNRDLFREAGLDPDRPPQTWDTLYDYAERLTLRDERGRIAQLGLAADNEILLLLGWQLGGDLASPDGRRITLNSPPYIEALRFAKRLVDIVGIEDYQRFFSMTGTATEANDAFYTGRIAMRLVTGYYLARQRQFAPDLDARLAAFPMPQDGVEPVSWISAFGVGMPRGCRNPEGAWAFIRYLISERCQLRIAVEMGMVPVLRAAALRPEVYADASRRVLIDMADRCRVYPKIPVVMDTYNQTVRSVEAVLYGRATPEQALAEAGSVVQDSLERYLRQDEMPLLAWRRLVYSAVALCAVVAAASALYAYRYARRGPAWRERLLAGYGFVMPWLVGFVALTAGPMAISVVYSLCRYQVLTPPRWAGLTNYATMLTDDPLFWKSLWNTLFYTGLSVPIGVAAALLLAVLLNQPLRGMRVFRTIFYLPTLVTGVAVGTLWMWMLQPEGIVNAALEIIGIRGPLWLADEDWSKPSLVLMSLWGVGGAMIVFLAGLQGIPRDLYEAATIDGAGAWRQVVHITLPLLSPTIFFVVVVGIIGSFQVFTQAYVVSGGQGGPLDSTLFYVFYLYRKGFEDFEMGYASAMAWVLFAAVFALTVLQLRLARRWVHY